MAEAALILKEQVYTVFTMNFFWNHVLLGDTLCDICIISHRETKWKLLPNFSLEESVPYASWQCMETSDNTS